MIRHLVLCGLGPGHLRLLAYLAMQPAHRHADIGISLLTRQRHAIRDAALLQTIALAPPADPQEAAEPLAQLTRAQAALLDDWVQKSGVRRIDNTPQGLDPTAKTLLLDDGRTLRFDWLSVEPEALQPRELIEHALPGARANGLFLRPREAFCKLWPQVQALAALQPLRFTLILNLNGQPLLATDAGQWPTEKFALGLAFALRHAFKGSAVTLVTGGAAIGDGLAPALQTCLQAALKKRHVTVLREAASGIAPGEVLLQSGARLACDVPMVLFTPVLPPWLLRSGLALDAQGQVFTDKALRSSQPFIFVNAQDAEASARQLFQGLRGVMAGRVAATLPVSAAQPVLSKNAVHRLDCGDGRSIVAWRNWAIESWRLWGGRR